MIPGNNNFFVHIFELVGTNIYKEVAFLKPSVGNSAPETPYIIKITEAEIKKAFRKEIRRNFTASSGKTSKACEEIIKVFQVIVFNRFPDIGGDFINFFTIDAIYSHGKYIIENDFGISIKSVMRNYEMSIRPIYKKIKPASVKCPGFFNLKK